MPEKRLLASWIARFLAGETPGVEGYGDPGIVFDDESTRDEFIEQLAAFLQAMLTAENTNA